MEALLGQVASFGRAKDAITFWNLRGWEFAMFVSDNFSGEKDAITLQYGVGVSVIGACKTSPYGHAGSTVETEARIPRCHPAATTSDVKPQRGEQPLTWPLTMTLTQTPTFFQRSFFMVLLCP